MRTGIACAETELWNYLRIGDGDTCPLYDNCSLRQSGHWCIIDHPKLVGDMSYLINPHSNNPHQRGEILQNIRKGQIFMLVEKLANRILDLANITSPPVPEAIIDTITEPDIVEMRLIPLRAYHGALWNVNGSWIIQINSRDDYCSRRLTIFHETFHILAHCNSTPKFRKIHNQKGAFNELLAEYFTYCILMPEKWVRQKWQEVYDVDAMASIFQVPKSSMVTMLSSLQLTTPKRPSFAFAELSLD